MAPVIDFFKNILLFHKMKIFLFFIFTVGFCLVLFPLTELGEKVVSEAGSSGIYLEFEKMELHFFPTPSVVMDSVLAETPMIEQLEITKLQVTPSVLSLLEFVLAKKLKPRGHISADGFFQGHLDVNVSSSSKIKDPQALNVELLYENFDVKMISQTFGSQWPLTPSGQGSVKALIDLEPSMKAQPEGTLEVQMQKFMIPQFELPTDFGPMQIPGLGFEKMVLKGQLKNGRLTLKETSLGSGQDELIIKLSGDVDVRIFPGGSPVVNYYNLAVDILMKRSMITKLGPTATALQTLLGKYSSLSGENQRFAFRIQAAGFSDRNPQLSAL
jgi:type II secretion system protein N